MSNNDTARIHTAYVGSGSNLGDAPTHLDAARRALTALPGCLALKASRLFLTEPQGRADQPWFHNQALRLDLDERWTPEVLLDALLHIETRLGRTRDPADPVGPRILDLDLLLFDQELRSSDKAQELQLPHPRMTDRAFVLVPLQEIAPGLIIPQGLTKMPDSPVEQLLAALPHRVEDGRIYQ